MISKSVIVIFLLYSPTDFPGEKYLDTAIFLTIFKMKGEILKNGINNLEAINLYF